MPFLTNSSEKNIYYKIILQNEIFFVVLNITKIKNHTKVIVIWCILSNNTILISCKNKTYKTK